MLFHMDPEKTRAEIEKWSKHDLANWDKYQAFLGGICDFWDKQVDNVPYNYIEKPTLTDKYQFLKNLIPRNLDVFKTSKFITSSVEANLNDWFESEILKGTLATDGIIGENLSIDHPSTGYVLLHHVMGALEEDKKGEWGYIEGGNGRLSQILSTSFKEMGGDIKLGSPVDKIIFDGKQSIGVRLQTGEIIEAKNILSNCTNQVTFEQLIKHPEDILSKQELNKIRSIEYNGACTKINIALKKLPKFKAFKDINIPLNELLQGTIHLNCESLETLKSCFHETRFNRISNSPFIDITIPSVVDPTLCPEGYYIMNALMQYTPYHPNMLTKQDKKSEIKHSMVREAFLETVNQYLEEPLDIHYMDILTPFDLERLLGMTEGNIFHGAIGLDNILFNRLSGKVGGIWLCGSSAHPGGGVMGAAGRQAALQVLRNGTF